MKLLKKFWDKCGEEKFTCRLITAGCTILTAYNLLFEDLAPEFDALLVTLNGVMILACILEGES